eukprot:Plantae.Rhodophyta-Palmaria_palmata.ctg31389.p1 GENE.Plantae.Rhodophyta-Palmaria_palmata.ctg31389~~Plantae.Rhodophyta-Palmaria_palmata.ctg31389.p1  ORF type:complete len:124 (+),score=18.32 Plantae.Rhodophyta-Palmaria_palmata.ctg31389:199-570(+)
MEQYKVAPVKSKLNGMSGALVSNYVRFMVAANLQTTKMLLSSYEQWAFSLAEDGSTSQGISFFYLRIRLFIENHFRNIHLLVVPFFERHTAVNNKKLICTLLDSIALAGGLALFRLALTVKTQ